MRSIAGSFLISIWTDDAGGSRAAVVAAILLSSVSVCFQ